MGNAALEVQKLGQSIWQDYIRRAVITSGELEELVAHEGPLGVTSNPSIFEKAIAGSADYDADIQALVAGGTRDVKAIYEHLALDDIRAAARVLEPAYRRSDGRDGYVSYEVSPHLAHDAEGTVREALRLSSAIGRPNVMIKVPGTPEGIPAIARRYGFAELAAARARGDFEELARRGRRLLRVHLGRDVRAGLDALTGMVRRALS